MCHLLSVLLIVNVGYSLVLEPVNLIFNCARANVTSHNLQWSCIPNDGDHASAWRVGLVRLLYKHF